MKILKAVVAWTLLSATGLSFGYATGTVSHVRVQSPDSGQVGVTSTSASVFLTIQSMDSSTAVCDFLGWILKDMSQEFEKQAYATLVTAKLNGLSVKITATQEGSVCRITSVDLL